jgi:hypothetical protein
VGAAAPVLPRNAALLLYIVAKAAQAAILAGRSTPPLLLLLWAVGAPLTAELNPALHSLVSSAAVNVLRRPVPLCRALCRVSIASRT